jgi:DNA-directed RNA polymerase subunit RPC12/RpoP
MDFMYQYECPECGAQVKVAQPVEAGKALRCPVCKTAFKPKKPPVALKQAAAKPVAAAKPAEAKPAGPVARPNVVEDDDENTDVPYGVVKETEEEKKLAEKNKPKFGEVSDKFARSNRGPAQALLVLPSNLLVGQGALTGLFGLIVIIYGSWGLIFTDASPSDEEITEAIVVMFGGAVFMIWAALVCLGASKMQSLESYAWALVGAVLGIFPLLAGIFAVIALRDPKVIAGFEEVEGAVEDGEDEDEKGKDDDDEDDEDEDEEEDEKPRKKKRK